jgi:nicotinate dehydrogenase subunit A
MSTAPLELQVNGATHQVTVDPQTPLLYVLRDTLRLHGPKFGCGLGECGACAVLLGGAAVRSCVLPVSAAVHTPVVTLEGLGTPEAPHPLQRAFIDEQAAQCGYCINGMIITAAAVLARHPDPSDAELRAGLEDTLCRCGTHLRILRAIRRAAGEMRSAGR